METPGKSQAYIVTAFFLTIVSTAQAKYSGGTGEPNDPYQIATAADLIALGQTPEDCDKHFLLTADIDLAHNLPGGKVFEKAIIAPDTNNVTVSFEGIPFTGVFDGNGHTISHLTIIGEDCLGLFGQVGQWDAPAAEIKNLALVDVNVADSGSDVGGLAGLNGGTISDCYSTGSVSGTERVGGLVGYDGSSHVTSSLWDIQTSGQSRSAGGTGKTTAQMQTASTFLDARWDFVDETANGTEDIWWIDESKDYPRLWWELDDIVP